MIVFYFLKGRDKVYEIIRHIVNEEEEGNFMYVHFI